MQSKDHKSAVERGIEIARSGKAANVTEVQEQLRAEGYGKAPLRAHGNQLRRTINEICARASKAVDGRSAAAATKGPTQLR